MMNTRPVWLTAAQVEDYPALHKAWDAAPPNATEAATDAAIRGILDWPELPDHVWAARYASAVLRALGMPGE